MDDREFEVVALYRDGAGELKVRVTRRGALYVHVSGAFTARMVEVLVDTRQSLLRSGSRPRVFADLRQLLTYDAEALSLFQPEAWNSLAFGDVHLMAPVISPIPVAPGITLYSDSGTFRVVLASN
jgi:hypothetical protein